MLNLILRSKAEIKVLGVVLFQDGLHLREIARQANISPFEARREVLILQKASLLTTQKRGNQTIASLNAQCPYLKEIKSLYLKTEGIFAQLKKSLSKFKNIRIALIYGSMASGKDTPKSDVDLLVVGEADERILAKELFKIQWKTTREINYNLWSETDFAKKAKEKGAFLAQIRKGKKVFLVGSDSEFSAISKAAQDTPN
ncbi:MAG: nucleotidyltransferase domain-containing protein [Candidatus Micrarchaeota archaeon]